jgi:hypothetical protein
MAPNFRGSPLLHALGGALDDAAHPVWPTNMWWASSVSMNGGAGEGVEAALGQRAQLVLAVAVGEGGEAEEDSQSSHRAR